MESIIVYENQLGGSVTLLGDGVIEVMNDHDRARPIMAYRCD